MASDPVYIQPITPQGAAILAAVAVVVLVTAVNNYQKEQQFRQLNQLSEDVQALSFLTK